MKKFRVTFHFAKEDSISFIHGADNAESLLETFRFEERGNDFANNNVLYRVNIANVNYVSVTELKK